MFKILFGILEMIVNCKVIIIQAKEVKYKNLFFMVEDNNIGHIEKNLCKVHHMLVHCHLRSCY